MAPARLTRPLDPIYQESAWAQPVQFLNEDRTPKDLTGQTATLSMVRMGLPAAAEEVTGVYQGDGVFLFGGTDEETTGWTAGRYAIEMNLDDAGAVSSMLVGEITVVKGAHAGGSAGMMPGAMQALSPVVGIVTSATAAVQVVTVDRIEITKSDLTISPTEPVLPEGQQVLWLQSGLGPDADQFGLFLVTGD